MSLWLRLGPLAVEVRPEKGADISAIVAHGLNILFQAPWGRRELAGAPLTGDSQPDWLSRYGGGWQQLVPNAGAPRTVDGVRRGYHGEAAVVAWTVESVDETEARMSTDLFTAPLHLTRHLSVDATTLRVVDTIRNDADQPVPVMWVQHPGFGAPFIDEHCTISAGARTVVTDAEFPGNVLPADTRAAFPVVPGIDGELDLTKVPGPASGRAVFGCLTDFVTAWFSIDSPTAGFGVRVEWDPDVLPHAWLWQECHASPGYPWYRRAYVVAIEPANVLPGEPSPGCPERGVTPLLDPGVTWVSDITVRLTSLD